MRRRAAVALLVLVGTALAIDPLRSWLFDVTPLPVRHTAVALWTGLLPDPDETADLAPVAYTGGNPYGINVFLEQEVEETKIRRSLETLTHEVTIDLAVAPPARRAVERMLAI